MVACQIKYHCNHVYGSYCNRKYMNCTVSDLNLLDWSVNNHLAVCLGGHVYLWNAATGDIQQLMEMENAEDYVSSVAWVKEGNYLAVGTSNAEVQVSFRSFRSL